MFALHCVGILICLASLVSVIWFCRWLDRQQVADAARRPLVMFRGEEEHAHAYAAWVAMDYGRPQVPVWLGGDLWEIRDWHPEQATCDQQFQESSGGE